MDSATAVACLPIDCAEAAVIGVALDLLLQHVTTELPFIASDSEWITGFEALQLRLTGVAQQLPSLDEVAL